LRLLPNIRYGTGRYPENVARRLRALNIATWIGSGVAVFFAITQILDPTPGLQKVAAINALAALVLMAVPLLHRIGPLAAPLAFVISAYAAIFVICFLLGTGTGMQFIYLVITALVILFLGTEHIVLSAVLYAVAAVLVIALETFVPRDTGLQTAVMTFASFIITTIASCAILFTLVLYGVREAEREHARSESLLANILPATIASRLKRRAESVIADRYDAASILFADMAGFTARASDTSPDDLVLFLNRAFTDFDRLVESHGLEKIKTTGDSYMVVSGVPAPRPDHAQALARLALAMRDAATDLHDPHGRHVPIRIGIGSGPVIAGVVGTRKFFYDVWGDAVNVASRMESTGELGKIQVSPDTYERLNGEFVLESRGVIDVKGKGEMQTWFLIGRKAPAAARN
jgi:adenylate cyclase